MKKNPLFFLLLLGGSGVSFSALAQDSSQNNREEYYSSTFQNTDFGQMDENGVSIEKELNDYRTEHQDTEATVLTPSATNITVIKKTSNIKTTMYYWFDNRGIKHFSDRAAAAPKGAKTLVVVASKPRYVAPVYEDGGNIQLRGPMQNPLETHMPPPQNLPPASLPPLPPLPF